MYATVAPEVDERELEKMVNPIVQEYFEHGDTKEVQVRCPDMKLVGLNRKLSLSLETLVHWSPTPRYHAMRTGTMPHRKNK